MTISLRAAGTATATAAAVTAINPAVPAGATADDLSILTVSVKPYNATVATPAGWEKVSESAPGTLATTAGDNGSMKVLVFAKVGAAVGSIGNLTQSSANSMIAVINTYAKTAAVWDYSAFVVGGDVAAGTNYSATGTGGMGLLVGDLLQCHTAGNHDIGITGSLVISHAGATLGTGTNRTNANTSTGNDCYVQVQEAFVTAVTTSIGPPAYSHASTAASGQGANLWLRIRETAAPAGPVLADVQMRRETATATTSLVSAPFTCTVGDVIVVKTVTGNMNVPTIGTPTMSGHTFTLRAAVNTSSKCDVDIWTTTITVAGEYVITQPFSGTAGPRSAVFERWANAVLAGSPAFVQTTGSSVGPSATITTTGSNSVVSWALGDWAALAQGTIALRSGALLEGTAGGDTTTYTPYYAEQDAATAGSQTIGTTTPAGAQNWSIAGIEILAAATLTPVTGSDAGAGSDSSDAQVVTPPANPYGTELAQDTFSGAGWDAAVWATARSATGSSATVVSGKGRANAGSNASYTGARGMKYVNTRTDVVIEGTVTIPPGASDGAVYIHARSDATFDTGTGYLLLVQPGLAKVELRKNVSYSGTTLQSSTQSIPAGTYRFVLSTVGTAIKAKWYVDGTSDPGWQFTATDSSITGPGAVGVMAGGAGTAGYYLDFDDVVFYDGVPVTGPTLIAGVDSAAGVDDAQTIGLATGDDAETGAESAAVVRSTSSSDTSTSADAAGLLRVSTGVDTATQSELATSVTVTAAGSDTSSMGDDAQLLQLVSVTDDSVMAESVTVILTITAADTSTMLDTASPATSGTAVESGTHIEVVQLLRLSGVADQGVTVESVSGAVLAASADPGVFTDAATVLGAGGVSGVDSSTGADSSVPAAAVGAVEAGVIVEAAAVAAVAGAVDSGSGSDASSVFAGVNLAVADSGSQVEGGTQLAVVASSTDTSALLEVAGLTAAVGGGDSGSTVDSSTVAGAGGQTGSDSSSWGELAGLAVVSTAADTSTGADSSTVLAGSAVADSSAGADSSTLELLGVTITGTDSSAGVEQVSLSAGLSGSGTAAQGESPAGLVVTVTRADTAALVEIVAPARSSSSADPSSWGELAGVGITLTLADSSSWGELGQVLDLTVLSGVRVFVGRVRTDAGWSGRVTGRRAAGVGGAAWSAQVREGFTGDVQNGWSGR